MYPAVVCEHSGISHAVAASGLIGSKILSHGLPGRGPVVFGIIVPDINIASGLVKLVENITKDASVRA